MALVVVVVVSLYVQVHNDNRPGSTGEVTHCFLSIREGYAQRPSPSAFLFPVPPKTSAGGITRSPTGPFGTVLRYPSAAPPTAVSILPSVVGTLLFTWQNVHL